MAQQQYSNNVGHQNNAAVQPERSVVLVTAGSSRDHPLHTKQAHA